VFAFTCRALKRRKKARETAHEMPISRLELAETAPELPLFVANVSSFHRKTHWGVLRELGVRPKETKNKSPATPFFVRHAYFTGSSYLAYRVFKSPQVEGLVGVVPQKTF